MNEHTIAGIGISTAGIVDIKSAPPVTIPLLISTIPAVLIPIPAIVCSFIIFLDSLILAVRKLSMVLFQK
jgi:hypothetical protein